MSRSARKFCDTGIYHIMFRGSNRQDIFLGKKDYEKMLEVLKTLKEKYEFELYAYCLMKNHVHFLIKEKSVKDISAIVHDLLTKYVGWFNIKYERTGTLMENRYKSKVVDNDEYFLHLMRYIHQNPLKAHIVDNIYDYPWSSWKDYIKPKKDMLTDSAVLEALLSKKEMIEFHAVEEELDFELFKKLRNDDAALILKLKCLGVEKPENFGYLPPEQMVTVFGELTKNFSDRHIVRVTGVSNYKIRQIKNTFNANGDGCEVR